MRPFLQKLMTEISDLMLARECIGCTTLGTLICANCLRTVQNRAQIMRDLRFDDLAEDLRIPLAIAHPYAPPIDAMIYRYKDNAIPELARLLANLLAGAIAQIPAVNPVFNPGVKPVNGPTLTQFPILIPIPSRKSSIRARGFDPMSLISDHLARSGFPIAPWLVDQRGAGRSKTLGSADRMNAAHDAFRVGGIPERYACNPIPVIVIDDVTTSGATLHAAVSQLLLAGVHVIGCAAVAGARKR
jgi:predicted amidophosphoribosyltransferase